MGKRQGLSYLFKYKYSIPRTKFLSFHMFGMNTVSPSIVHACTTSARQPVHRFQYTLQNFQSWIVAVRYSTRFFFFFLDLLDNAYIWWYRLAKQSWKISTWKPSWYPDGKQYTANPLLLMKRQENDFDSNNINTDPQAQRECIGAKENTMKRIDLG